MEESTSDRSGKNLDEFELINTLRQLRTYIPDSPWLNPIISVAFDVSRRLEGGEISFDELKALAGRLMDRACITRAHRLRERVGFKDSETTHKEFTSFVEQCFNQAGDGEAGLAAVARRFSRATAGIVFYGPSNFRCL